MITETRVIDANLFLSLERSPDGTYIGKVIRLEPPSGDPMASEASGRYTEYRTSVCRSAGDAELESHTILEKLRADAEKNQ